MEYVYFYCFCDDDISKVSVSCLIYMINVKLTNCFAGMSWKTRQTRTNQLKLMFLRGCLVSRLNPWDGMSEFWSRPEYFHDEQWWESWWVAGILWKWPGWPAWAAMVTMSGWRIGLWSVRVFTKVRFDSKASIDLLQESMENIGKRILTGFSPLFHSLFADFSRSSWKSCNFIKVDQLHKG